MRFIATCKMGLEALVANELRALDIGIESVSDAKVVFTGGYFEMARACLWLRTAERVLMIVGEFHAETFEELFSGVRAIRWKDYIGKNDFIHVNGKSAKSKLFAVSDCQSITKKAIVDSLFEAYRTNSLPENGDEIIIEVGLLRDEVTVALDCCGAGLSRRGYRTWNVAAPIAETLGAAMIELARYNGDIALVDPMCGSGTMPIEAAMIARNMAVGMNRSFAAEKWAFMEGSPFELAREQARDAVVDIVPEITGSDIDPHAIEVCKKHAKKAGVTVKWLVRPLSELAVPRESGIIVCNPPYGERLMEKRDAEKLYRQMREVFAPLTHWDVNVITSHKDFERIYGEKADKRRKLSNGGMTCTLYRYFAKEGFIRQ
ncbi:MAG: class I SAM-dependent RNA methyltransferase [Clostridiales bacterium]|nr:class I SAM-dependent RNA methyltransferase [Clostridiales bacterium]